MKNPPEKSVCNICGRPATLPYRVHDARGKIVQGCIDDFHTGHLVVPSESASWHYRPAAKKWRAEMKRRAKTLGASVKSLGSRAYNPRDPEMSRAAKLYESFRERAPRRVAKLGILPPPRIAVDIGHVEYIGYRTTHGRKLTLYQHDFAPGSRPLLCVSPDGRQLLLIGGRYQFTERGIVDHDIDGREIENPAHGKAMRSNPRRRKNAVLDPEHKALLRELAGHFEKDEAGEIAEGEKP